MVMASEFKIPGWFTTEQAADHLQIKADTLRRYANRQLIKPGKRIGNYLLFSDREVKRFAKERRSPGNPNFRRTR